MSKTNRQRKKGINAFSIRKGSRSQKKARLNTHRKPKLIENVLVSAHLSTRRYNCVKRRFEVGFFV